MNHAAIHLPSTIVPVAAHSTISDRNIFVLGMAVPLRRHQDLVDPVRSAETTNVEIRAA